MKQPNKGHKYKGIFAKTYLPRQICFDKFLINTGGSAPGPPEFTLFAYKVDSIGDALNAAHYFIGLALPLKVALQRCLYPVRKQLYCTAMLIRFECKKTKCP